MKTLTPSLDVRPGPDTEPVVLPEERSFYEQYSWCLNAFPRMADIIKRLRDELCRPELEPEDWRRGELAANVFLFSCALSDTVDDFLSGPRYDFSQAARVFGPAGVIVRPLNHLLRASADFRIACRRHLLRWRANWEEAVVRLTTALGADVPNPISDSCKRCMLGLLEYRFPSRLLSTRVRIPAAFRSQDLTHFDGLELGRILAEDCPDRSRPILVAGLRTAGSYFAPLVRGYLEAQRYRNVETITLRPKQGLSARERAQLAQAAANGALVAIVDEPVDSAGTLARAVESMRQAGFPVDDIRALFPAHPFRRGWRNGTPGLALSGLRALTLEPGEWNKRTFLESQDAVNQIREYFKFAGKHVLGMRLCPAHSHAMSELSQSEDPGLHWRLKRVYEVEVESATGAFEKQYVLAKSAGWGWLGYHSFLAGTRLAPFVPPLLGLRHGVVFMQWQPRDRAGDRQPPVDPAASYIARRVRCLNLTENPTRDLAHAGRHRGIDELAAILGGAYGWKLTAALKRPSISRELARLVNPLPTLIDGKMRQSEWVGPEGAPVKADFEHHGMGKHELNVTDPAFDLAETILHWDLTLADEQRLINRYVEQSGDGGVSGRLILQKLLAGTWAMNQAIRKLNHPAMWGHRQEINREYLQAWRFLTTHVTRFCAGLCRRPETSDWSEPLVVLDVDGVLDKQIFGFPSTTAAGIKAVSLLASHGMTCALNTARSVSNLKEYCRAYGFLGGSAEYGSFVWDAGTGRERVLVSPDSQAQIEQLRNALREIPGVFLDPDFRLIVRAYTYAQGRTVPVPEMVIRGLIANLHLDRLRIHQTYTDSAAMAAECNKGSGLKSFLELTGHSEWSTVAVGDSEPDLAMFHTAARSFAPGHIGCPGPARLLGCRIARKPYQGGLLESVRTLVHPDGGTCDRCRIPQVTLAPADELLRRLLVAADRHPAGSLLRAVLDPQALRAFLN
ncbi:MAG TPA: HAD hydrolase family protein [Bryobacteraceae bacterium]|nr:HAD hydrolase family protein [Bryobacteraceae bacterium]